jgi:atonal protein 1/7
LAVLQQRRLAANARERKITNKINFAFNMVRKVLPGFEDREISKYEAIQLAQDYIKQLVEVLETDGENKENHEDISIFNRKPE